MLKSEGGRCCCDHHLVVAFIRLKLRSVGQKNLGHRHYDVDKLKDQKVRRAFVLQVKNRFQALEHSEEEAETTEATREQVNSK